MFFCPLAGLDLLNSSLWQHFVEGGSQPGNSLFYDYQCDSSNSLFKDFKATVITRLYCPPANVPWQQCLSRDDTWYHSSITLFGKICLCCPFPCMEAQFGDPVWVHRPANSLVFSLGTEMFIFWFKILKFKSDNSLFLFCFCWSFQYRLIQKQFIRRCHCVQIGYIYYWHFSLHGRKYDWTPGCFIWLLCSELFSDPMYVDINLPHTKYWFAELKQASHWIVLTLVEMFERLGEIVI